MTAPTRTPRGKGRPWIALFTSLLNDTDLILAGQDARALYPLLMLHSAEQGLDGCVPADPRKVQLFAHFDNGVAAVKAALDALLDIDKLVRVDENTLSIRTWDRYQADFGGSTTRSETARLSALKRHHNAGKHADTPADGCPLCDGTETVTAAPAPAQATPAAEGKRTMKAALSDFRAAIPETLAEFTTPFEGYTTLLGAADEFALVIADLSDNARGALRNEVLAHALRNLVDENLPYPAINRANKAAKALGDDGHKWWVHAAILGAGKSFEDEKHCLNWLTATARSERTKAVSA